MVAYSKENCEEIAAEHLPLYCLGKHLSSMEGHPRVYLPIGPQNTQVSCPYCSRQYVFTSK